MTDYLRIYDGVFSNEGYNRHPPSEPRFVYVMQALKKTHINSLIDIGTGRGTLLDIILKQYPHIALTAVDLNNYPHLKHVPHINADITKIEDRKRITGQYDILTCLDCLEHVEEEHITDILNMFLSLSNRFIFSIANHSDVINGVELHKIQKPFTYWMDRISEFFDITFFEAVYNGRLYLYECKRKM